MWRLDTLFLSLKIIGAFRKKEGFNYFTWDEILCVKMKLNMGKKENQAKT